MLPNSVFHKRNGHRTPPGKGPLTSGDLVRLVHSAPRSPVVPSADLMKFAILLRPESSVAGWEQFSGDGYEIPSALSQALASGQRSLEQGELGDVRASLEAIQARADWAAAVIARLTDLVGRGGGAPLGGRPRALVDLNDLVLRALRLFRGQSVATATVSTALDPMLPLVPGDVRQLTEVLGSLVLALTEANATVGGPGAIAVETSCQPGVLRGETFVCVTMTNTSAPIEAPATAAGEARWPETPGVLRLYRAGRIVREHGGVLSVAAGPRGLVRVRLELPAI